MSIFGARRGQARPVVCGGAACGGVRWESLHRKKLCLSLLMSKNLKLKKVNKSFVPELIACFSDSDMRYEHSMNMSISRIYILVVF